MKENEKTVNRFWDEVYNQGNFEAMDDIFAPGYVLHDLADRKDRGVDRLREILSEVQAAVPDTRITIEDQISAEEGKVVTRFKIHVPAQDVAQESSSGDGQLELNGISISRVSGGRIEETWLLWEALLAEQEIKPGTQFWRWPPWRW